MMSSNSLVRGVGASGALFIVSSIPRVLLEFPKRSVALGAHAMPTSFPAIRSLENLVVERASAPTVGVSYLASTSKFIMHDPGSGGCVQRAQDLYWFWQNVPTSNHRWLALRARLMIKLIVGVTSSREREERLLDLLSGWKWSLEVER
jgi:hypothetical protein